tara:strand:- start:339 stop:1181 length:843 start_codon:yes stop_codon:yes gene_type:complete
MLTNIKSRQTLKLVIYILLLINFVLYIIDDIRIASYTLQEDASFLDWTQSFATTIDESAWLILLFLFELETYMLSDEAWSKSLFTRFMYFIRACCYIFLMHSVYAFSVIYYDLMNVQQLQNITNLCELVPLDMTFVRNLSYTTIDSLNCHELSNQSVFYFTEPNLVVSDMSGLQLERNLALVDLLEILVWLLILITIEAMVWLQDRAITQGKLISLIKVSKYFLYGMLWSMAAYWTYLGHYYFAWDEAVWIVGFISIEMNVSQWKDEIEREKEPKILSNL